MKARATVALYAATLAMAVAVVALDPSVVTR